MDGIIGSVLASRAKRERFAKGFEPEDVGIPMTTWETLSEWEKEEQIEDWAVGVEVESELDNNPIAQKRSDLELELSRQEPSVKSWSVRWQSYPPIKDAHTPQERIKEMEIALRNGATITLKTPDFGDVSATAWLPNFQAISYTDVFLVEDIAYILAAIRLKKLRAQKRK